MMEREPYSFACCVNRLGEFYSYEDVDHYIHNIEINNLDVHEAMYFLDSQTRIDYDGTEEPSIDNYLLYYLIYKSQDSH